MWLLIISKIIKFQITAGSFTNKIDESGHFIDGIDQVALFNNTLAFFDVANYIANKLSPENNYKLLNNYLVVYRFVEREHSNYNIIQPIPMSCSWSIDFVKEWGGGKKMLCI